MKISKNNTIVDLAFNLSGSLAGIPVILQQLPVGERIGVNNIPQVWEDVNDLLNDDEPLDDIGQTWTPNIAGLDLTITDVPLYNIEAQAKQPYSSNIYGLLYAAAEMNEALEGMLLKKRITL